LISHGDRLFNGIVWDWAFVYPPGEYFPDSPCTEESMESFLRLMWGGSGVDEEGVVTRGWCCGE